MSEQHGIALIMPAHNEESYVEDTILSIPDTVDFVLFVNDGSTDSTLKTAQKCLIKNGRTELEDSTSKLSFKILNQENLGVGAAVFNGLKVIKKLEKNKRLEKHFPKKEKWIVLIMDSDGQMDPNDIPNLIKPIINNSADHVKGNRIGLEGMPKIRKFGSYLLKILMRLASGYPFINDTQCGFRAISLEMIKLWDFSKIWNDYGYTNWWLLESGRRSFKLKEVPVKSIYKRKKSKLKIRKFLPNVSLLIFKKLWKRGWQWYVLGKGTESTILRITVSSFWFSSIFAFSGLFLFSKHWMFLLIYSVLGLLIVKRLDIKESKRRLNQKKSPLIS